MDKFFKWDLSKNVTDLKEELESLGYMFSIEYDTYTQKIFHPQKGGIAVTFPRRNSGTMAQDRKMIVIIREAFVIAAHSVVFSRCSVIEERWEICEAIDSAVAKELETRS